MTDEQKIELLKGKFNQMMQAAFQKDPKADTIFLAFFNAVKDSDALFAALVDDKKAEIDAQVAQAQQIIDKAPALKAELPDISKPAKV